MSNEDQQTVVGELRKWRKQFCSPNGEYVFWGFIYGDTRLRFPDGHWIHTAKISKIEGKLAYTITGSVYRLIGEAGGSEVNPWAV